VSRGYGKLQRRILKLLEQHPGFWARDLLPSEPTRSQRSALSRALASLHDDGKIKIAAWLAGRHPSAGKSIVYRVDGVPPRATEIPRLFEHNVNV
jgi:hypothetical protein